MRSCFLIVADEFEKIEGFSASISKFRINWSLTPILLEAGADVSQATQPFNFLRLQLALAVDDAHVDFQPVLVCQQLFHAVIEFEERADQNQAV